MRRSRAVAHRLPMLKERVGLSATDTKGPCVRQVMCDVSASDATAYMFERHVTKHSPQSPQFNPRSPDKCRSFSVMIGLLFWNWTPFGGPFVYLMHYRTACVSFTHSWDVVHTYKVQFSNDSLVWKPCMNGTQEAVSDQFLFFLYKLLFCLHGSRLHIQGLSSSHWHPGQKVPLLLITR